MSKFISGRVLMERWRIRDFELAQVVLLSPLTPLNEFGEIIYHPAQIKILKNYDELKAQSRRITGTKERQRLEDKIREYTEIHDLGVSGWNDFGLPSDPDDKRQFISILSNSLYLIEVVEKIEEDENLVSLHGIKVQKESSPHPTSRLKSSPTTPENDELLRSIGKEAEIIYEHIVKAVGVTDKSINSRTARRDSAIAYFQKNEHVFKNLREDYLNDLAIYDFKSNQSKRDYMRRLLRRVFKNRFPEQTFSGAKLYDTYRQMLIEPISYINSPHMDE